MIERGEMLEGGWGKSGGSAGYSSILALFAIIFLVQISVDFLRNLISSSVSTWHSRA